MFSKLSYLRDLVSYNSLDLEDKQITIYSENSNYWPHLENLVREFLLQSKGGVCFVTSSKEDRGLKIIHPKLKTFTIGSGKCREIFFKQLKTEMLIMTMPDLDNYQIKKSNYNVHYVYTQHSLNSLHMAYREKAFNNFNTILCAGFHHEREMVEIEKVYDIKPLNKLRYRYEPPVRLKEILKSQQHEELVNKKNILVAPTWGPNGLIESGLAQEIIESCLALGFAVKLRPHPETIKHSSDKINKLKNIFNESGEFNVENGVADFFSLLDSSLLITDWSGVAFDFALGLSRPVIFVDCLPKVNNEKYKKISIEPIEIRCRDLLGVKLSVEEIPKFLSSDQLTNFISKVTFENFYDNSAENVVSELLDFI